MREGFVFGGFIFFFWLRYIEEVWIFIIFNLSVLDKNVVFEGRFMILNFWLYDVEIL